MSTRTPAPTVSAVFIVKNEEDVLAPSLASVRWADQVVVYDTGSTDRTLAIAREHADTVVEGYWDDDFAGARNRALAHATSDWILILDADEIFEGSPEMVRRRLGRGGATQHTVIVDSGDAAVLPLAPRDLTGQFASVRLFLRGQYCYAGQIHEQVVRCAPGTGTPAMPLVDVVVRHSGYIGGDEVIHAKGERNLAIALRHLDEGIAQDASDSDLELRRIQVVRSYLFAGRPREGLDLATTMLDQGFVVGRNAVILANAVIGASEALDGPQATDRWFDVWEKNDENPAAARLRRAKQCAVRDDPAAALHAVEGIPTTTLNSRAERVERIEAARIEVWALARLGKARRAMQVATAAAARGVAPGTPAGLARLLGEARCRTVIGSLTDTLWREYVTACLMDPEPPARAFLAWMHDARPGDATVLAGVAVAAPSLSIEEATQWSVLMRRHGAVEHCPLVRIAEDPGTDPRQRAIAGALAYSAYGDERGLAGLEDALAQLPSDQEVELLAHLDVVAPGLVSPVVHA